MSAVTIDPDAVVGIRRKGVSISEKGLATQLLLGFRILRFERRRHHLRFIPVCPEGTQVLAVRRVDVKRRHQTSVFRPLRVANHESAIR